MNFQSPFNQSIAACRIVGFLGTDLFILVGPLDGDGLLRAAVVVGLGAVVHGCGDGDLLRLQEQ